MGWRPDLGTAERAVQLIVVVVPEVESTTSYQGDAGNAHRDDASQHDRIFDGSRAIFFTEEFQDACHDCNCFACRSQWASNGATTENSAAAQGTY